MKNILCICILMVSASLFSQSSSDVSKEFKFDNETAQEEVSIMVEPGMKALAFQFRGQIENGELKITIKDPKGKREGGFQLKSKSKTSTSTISSSGGNSNSSSSSSSNSNSSSNSSDGHNYSFSSTSSENGKTSGSMMKQIDNPISGEWKIIIQLMDVTGKAALMVGQQQ